MRRVLQCLGAAGIAIGLLGLLDSYWRWIGVALGYPPLLSGSVGSCLLLVGLSCLLLANRATTPGGASSPDAKKVEADERA
jgi:hypothetical protein